MRIRSSVVTGLGALALVVAGFVGLSHPAQAASQNVTVSCVGGKPTFPSNNLEAAPGDTITLLNSTGERLWSISEYGVTAPTGTWPNTTSNVFTVVSPDGAYVQLIGEKTCPGMSTPLWFRAPGTPPNHGNNGGAGGKGGAGGSTSGVSLSGSLEGLVLRSEHFSELAMKDEVALLAATTKEAQIAAAEKAIIHEKAALKASEKVLQALTHPTQPSR
jgi:plastocyanin